jgi:hypothetical protein
MCCALSDCAAVKRLRVEQALAHPWLASLHDPADEPACLQASQEAQVIATPACTCPCVCQLLHPVTVEGLAVTQLLPALNTSHPGLPTSPPPCCSPSTALRRRLRSPPCSRYGMASCGKCACSIPSCVRRRRGSCCWASCCVCWVGTGSCGGSTPTAGSTQIEYL